MLEYKRPKSQTLVRFATGYLLENYQVEQPAILLPSQITIILLCYKSRIQPKEGQTLLNIDKEIILKSCSFTFRIQNFINKENGSYILQDSY